MASDHGSWGAAALLPLDIAEVRNAKPSLLLFIHCILIRNTLPMLWSCGNLACLHPKLLPVCLWDVIYLESLGKHIPQRDPRFISGASVDISLLHSQWFSLCHCSLAGSLPRLNKDLKKKILPLVAILHGLVVVKPFWAGAEQWIVFLISFFNLHFFKPLLQQMVELHVHTLFSLQLMVFFLLPSCLSCAQLTGPEEPFQ